MNFEIIFFVAIGFLAGLVVGFISASLAAFLKKTNEEEDNDNAGEDLNVENRDGSEVRR